MVVTARATPAEHRIFLFRLECGPAEELGVFVGLEVAHADHDRIGVVRRGDARHAAGELVDEILLLRLITFGEALDLAARGLVLDQVEAHKGHRMDLYVVGDNELHAGEAHAVRRQTPPAEGS